MVEDEAELREMLIAEFNLRGALSEGLSNGDTALEKIHQMKPNVVVLDHTMPGKNGKAVIREVRSDAKSSEVPILMLTGLGSEEEKIAALELGADDYMTKPFSLRELVVRIQALVRRSELSHKSTQTSLVLENLNLDLKAHKAYLSGNPLQLTLTEYRILAELMRQGGQVLTRDQLRERALGNLNVTDRTIDVHMAALRKKLEGMGDRIETIRGVGYRILV